MVCDASFNTERDFIVRFLLIANFRKQLGHRVAAESELSPTLKNYVPYDSFCVVVAIGRGVTQYRFPRHPGHDCCVLGRLVIAEPSESFFFARVREMPDFGRDEVRSDIS